MKENITLRTRTAWLIGLTFLLLVVALYVLFSTVVMQEFQKIEFRQMSNNVERVLRALDSDARQLVVKTEDWAKWDDTYVYIKDRNKKYQESVLNYETVASLKMDHLLYLNKDGKLFDGYEINTTEGRTIPLNDEFVRSLNLKKEIIQPSNPDSMPTGYLLRGDKVIIYASVPILDSTRTKPIRGALLSTHIITEEFIKGIAEQTRLNVDMFAVTAQNRERLSNIISAFTSDSPSFVKAESLNELSGWGEVKDAEGNVILLCKISAPRSIFNQGLATRNLVMICAAIAGLFATIFVLFALNHWVLSRLFKLKGEVAKVDSNSLNGARVSVYGRDEISSLSSAINLFLSALEQTQSDLIKSRSVAESANAAKSMFIARVSHELRTPIGGIIGINHMILKREKSKAIRELVKMSDQAADGLLSVINEILDFSKAEVGELTFERIPFNLRDVVRQTMRVIAARLEGRYKPGDLERLELVCDVDPIVPDSVLGDPTKLKQILINLLGNAVKFTQSGYVGLKVSLGGAGIIEFRVWDSGIGIPADKLGTIFTPFKQADESVTRKYQGTGLGLSIVKQFTEGLGGKVLVNSIPGKGSEFTVSMPLAENSPSEQSLKQASSQPGWPKDAYLLAVKTPVSEALVANLSDYGIKVTLFDPASGDESELLKLKNAALVVVSEESLNNGTVRALVESRIVEKNGCTVATLRPSSIALHEELHKLGVEYILPIPVMADDLICACLGKLTSADKEPASIKPSLMNGAKLRVLIADDTPTNRMILEDMLGDAGHQVISVNDGTEVIERLTPMITGAPHAEHFDIVLTDVSMTLMDGDVATRAIRTLEDQHGRSMHIPIIAVTAHAMLDEQQKIMAAGMDGVLTKPLRPEAVAAELLRVLSGNQEVV